ncbi:MAG: OmpA family protein [Breznakibacter sp.]|nr:OmpA family protein [Breznakibacter sp.]
MKKLLSIVLIALVAFSCVPVRQFNSLKKKNNELETLTSDLTKENIKQTTQNTELKSMVQRLTRMLQEMRQDSIAQGAELAETQKRVEDLSKQYEDLLVQYQNGSGDAETSKLLSHLQLVQDQLQKREDALRYSERNLGAKSDSLRNAIAELEATQKELELRNKRLVELERILASKDSAMNELKNLVSNALTGFGTDELKVHTKNGKVYVSLEEKLLFGSGSYEVGAQGVTALNRLSAVLAKNKDINILVEGHTDDVPYQGTGKLIDNWDLSAKRATSVSRILLSNKAIDPRRITAAGRGEFLPLVNAKSPEARQKNRRTEIILTPKLDKILDILDNNN